MELRTIAIICSLLGYSTMTSLTAHAQVSYGGIGGVEIGSGLRVGSVGGLDLDSSDDDDEPSLANSQKALANAGFPTEGNLVVQWARGEGDQTSLQNSQKYVIEIGLCKNETEASCSLVTESDPYTGASLIAGTIQPEIKIPIIALGRQLAENSNLSKFVGFQIYEHHMIRFDRSISMTFADTSALKAQAIEIETNSVGKIRVSYENK